MLNTCSSCQGFIPVRLDVCPHCDAPGPSRAARAAKVATCGAMMFTLMACYGGGYYDDDGYRDVLCDDGTYVSYWEDCDNTTRECGNGVVEYGEGCDDGNLISGDGCSASCQTESCDEGSLLPLGTTHDNVSSGAERIVPSCTSQSYPGTGRERVYQLDGYGYGTLDLSLTGEGVVMYATDTCPLGQVTASEGGEACSALPFNGEPTTLSLQVGNVSRWLVVDEVSRNTGGDFQLEATFTPACGNGTVDAWAAEQCDDDNGEDGDGCSASCQREPQVLCDGATALVEGAQTGDTSDAPNLLGGEGCGAGEALHQYTAAAAGNLLVVATAAHDVSLKWIATCDASGLDASCESASKAGGSEALVRHLEAGETVWLAVDGVSADDAGSFDLDVTFTLDTP